MTKLMTTKDRTESTNSTKDYAEHKVRTGYFIEYKRRKKKLTSQ